MLNRFYALSLVLCLAGCMSDAGLRVRLSDDSYPAAAEWKDLPESVQARYIAMADEADPDQRLDRPPYPVGGMAGLMDGLTYPRAARRANIQGRVVVRAVIAADGSVEGVDVVESVHPLLDEEAVAAVERSAFEPAMRDGQPVAASICAPFRFTR